MRHRSLPALLLALAGLAPALVLAGPADELLSLHEKVLRAHRESDVELLLADESDDYVVANRGDITRPTLEQRRARLGGYLRATRFTEYRDLAPPIATVSADGTLGWVVVQVQARGTQAGPAGEALKVDFTSAWIELYRKDAGRWKRIGNVSNFRP
jgi:hypothetical protein